MPYAKPRITRPLPRPAARRAPWRPARPAPGGTLPFSAQLGTWGFAVRVYVAWDSATTADPNWIEVTEFVDIPAGIRISRGRPDAEQQCQVGTCTLTVDNSDGRWSPANTNGAWFGQIRKGCWLRVDVIPPSQTASTRFTGFIQQLPVTWSGQYSQVAISASDRFVLLGNAPKFQSAIVEEWLNDPVGSQYIAGYWPLHEPSAATYASDISGQAPANQSTLAVKAFAVNPGNGVAFANTAAPGYDGLSTVTFTPIGTGIFGTGSLPFGGYLQGNVGPNGNVAQITMWVNTTVADQPFLSWSDPTSNYVFGLSIDPNGYLCYWQESLSGSTSVIGDFYQNGVGRYPVADGIWHQVSLKLQTAAATASTYDATYIEVSVDGVHVSGALWGTNPLTTFAPPATLTRLTVGAGEGWYSAIGYVGLCMFTGSLSDLVVHLLPSSTLNVDFYGSYQAGTTMWQSPNAAYPIAESCGRRIIRLAQYAGVPAPIESFTLPNFANPAYDIEVGVTAFINIPAETAHPAGIQQLQAQQPLTALQAVSATENMPLFADKQNRITLQPSMLRQNPTPAFTINALDLDKTTAWADDFQYLQNEQVITASGQGALTVDTNGLTSQALNGVYSNSVSTVTINPLESGSLGAAMNLAGANPAPRHNPLALEVATLANQTITVPVPSSIATSAAAWPLNLVQTLAAYYGDQVFQTVIPAGATASMDALDITAVATATTTYAFQGQVAIPVGAQAGSFRLVINWLNASSGIISQSFGTTTAISAGTAAPTGLTVSGTAPTGTVSALLRLEMMASPAAGFAIQASGLQWQTGAATAWQLPGGSSPNLLTVDQATAGQGTPYTGAPAYGRAFYDAVLAAEISTAVGIVGWPEQSASASTGAYYVEGYTETITAGQHMFGWNTSPVQGATYQCDSPTLGLCDTPGLTLAY